MLEAHEFLTVHCVQDPSGLKSHATHHMLQGGWMIETC